jgi:hypothetical protein
MKVNSYNTGTQIRKQSRNCEDSLRGNMYVTRPLSRYKKFPSELSLPPPEGPNSGILVILDEEAEATCCFGLCKSHGIKDLPFPQNKNLTLLYSMGQHTDSFYAALIPVLNHPLSFNRYYAIKTRGSHKGYLCFFFFFFFFYFLRYSTSFCSWLLDHLTSDASLKFSF